jgi:hypothetical protein
MAYLDDVIVLGKNCADHLENLTRVLDIFKKYNWKLKTKKCNLFQNEIKFLGKIISADGIKINPENVVAVKNCQVPKTRKMSNPFWDSRTTIDNTYTALLRLHYHSMKLSNPKNIVLGMKTNKIPFKIKNYPSGSCQIKLPKFKR